MSAVSFKASRVVEQNPCPAWVFALPRRNGKARALRICAMRAEASVEEKSTDQLRHILHDLSNLLTGIMVTGGLLQLALQGDRRQHYAAEICEGSERGANL